jgi:hypothetical protein
MRTALKVAWPAAIAAAGSKGWRLLIEAGILLGLMMGGTWLTWR